MQTKSGYTEYKPSVGYAVTIPAGTRVVKVDGNGGGYAVENPRLLGVNDHDATHYWFWVPAEIVE